MHSHLHTEAVEDGESSNFKFSTLVKMVSLQPKPSKSLKEKLTPPRVRSAIFFDETKALRYRNPGKLVSDNCATFRGTELGASSFSTGNCQKPWPSGKGAGVEELVKYMSRMPGYLQHLEREENVQEKALNFGVINWRHLESWKGNKMMDKKDVVSSSINQEESSPFSRNLSSLYLARRSSMPLAQRTKISCLKGKVDQSTEDERTSVLEDKSRCFYGLSKSNISQLSSMKPTKECRSFMQFGVGSSVEEEKLESCQKQCCTSNAGFSDDRLERNYIEVSGAWDHLQESCLRTKTLYFLHDDKKVADANVALPTTKKFITTKFLAKHEKGNQINRSLMHLVTNITEKPIHKKVEGLTGGRKQHLSDLPSDCGLKWINGSSSLREGSLAHLTKETNSLGSSNDKERSNSRGRRSPLRRILDPLLKTRNHSNSETTASSSIPSFHERHNDDRLSTGKTSTALNIMPRSSDDSICSSSSQLSSNPQDLCQDGKPDLPLQQAVLKLSWKNTPLFMFSTNDNSVLLASMRTSCSNKDNFCGMYTIYKTRESSKKKGGSWIGHSRNRKSNLLYDIVGRLQVSCHKLCSDGSKNIAVVKEFVMVSLSNGANSSFTNELAAVIIKTPCGKFHGSNSECEDHSKGKCSSLHTESLQIEHYPEISFISNIMAILPRGTHGSSDTGKPASLIERWKSGGSCDCGGWDEGCSLTVLADRYHETNANGFGHIKLFVEGGKSEHAFSILAFKEGLYTVDFSSSISSMQAFVISIANLHSRNSNDTIEHPIQRKSLKEYLYDKYPKMNLMQNDGGPTSYVPHCPPVSPAGRA